jgi:pimeloyl-ACP methyl ester carboxylesterase
MSVRDYQFDPSRFRNLRTPIRFLAASDTLPVYKAAIQVLHGSLPHSHVVVLPGQGHEAVVMAPELVLREVSGLLLDDR